jgi:NAD(P)-dependent dehydrogenase (short-subunit alcohol dehydrogenase family)
MSKEKVAPVTAGGSGMGAEAAHRLAQDGFKIGVLSSYGKGEALAKELGGFGVTGSNQSSDDLKRLVDGAIERWGRIDVLVNNAGHARTPIATPEELGGRAREWWRPLHRHAVVKELADSGATRGPGSLHRVAELSREKGPTATTRSASMSARQIRTRCNLLNLLARV